jgi:acetyl-CoA acetyltransferase
MPYVASVGTYLPCWGTTQCRAVGDGGVAAFQLRQIAADQNDRSDRTAGNQRGVAGLDGEGDRVVASVRHQHKPDMTTFPATTCAAKQTFAMAVVTPVDVDVTEVHDFFSGIELIGYEDLGFAERFGGYKLVEAEVTGVGGALPVNPSGGLKAKGHPPGATGVA